MLMSPAQAGAPYWASAGEMSAFGQTRTSISIALLLDPHLAIETASSIRSLSPEKPLQRLTSAALRLRISQQVGQNNDDLLSLESKWMDQFSFLGVRHERVVQYAQIGVLLDEWQERLLTR